MDLSHLISLSNTPVISNVFSQSIDSTQLQREKWKSCRFSCKKSFSILGITVLNFWISPVYLPTLALTSSLRFQSRDEWMAKVSSKPSQISMFNRRFMLMHLNILCLPCLQTLTPNSLSIQWAFYGCHIFLAQTLWCLLINSLFLVLCVLKIQLLIFLKPIPLTSAIISTVGLADAVGLSVAFVITAQGLQASGGQNTLETHEAGKIQTSWCWKTSVNRTKTGKSAGTLLEILLDIRQGGWPLSFMF